MAEAAMGAQAIGGVIGAVGAIKTSQSQAANDEYNANVERQQASNVLLQSKADATAHDIQAQEQIGQQQADVGASGVTGAGSALSLLGMSVAHAKLDEQMILYKGNVQATGYMNEAALNVYSGKLVKQQGYLAAAGALIGAGGKVGATGVIANAGKSTDTAGASAMLMDSEAN